MKTVKAYLVTVLLGGLLGIFFSVVADRLTLDSFNTIAREAKVIALLPVYDDPHIRRLVGYLEVYDSSEGLLLVR
jgi:hypothetical protein